MSHLEVLTLLLLALQLVLRSSAQAPDDVIRPTFHPPLAGDAMNTVCSNFTQGNYQQREFYSPGYPANYPNKTDCIHLLIAPRGYRIRLDFRDEFKIEPSDECKYDYVEFRDGPFGYSPIIGRYCGGTHPPMMQSSSRFIWVHFRSDDSIEYQGFRAVYDYYKPEVDGPGLTPLPNGLDFSIGPDEVCRIVVNISSHDGYVQHDDITEDYKQRLGTQALDCTWAFYLPSDLRLMLRFENIQTIGPVCDQSFLEIYEDSTAPTDRKKRLCGSVPSFFKTSSNHVYVRNYGAKEEFRPQFRLFYTVFMPGPCIPSMFDCGDTTCINQSLQCNGRDNCNYKWDEDACETSTTVEPTREPFVIQYHTVIIGIVGGAILTIIFLAIVVTCYQKSREERQQRSLHHEERRTIEVEMTNLLNRSPQHANAVFAHPLQTNPNGPVNHVSAAGKGPVGNHVNPGAVRGNGHTGDHQRRSPDGGDYVDSAGKDWAYGRYLDIHGQGSSDMNNPKTLIHNQIPTVATIEKRPSVNKTLTLNERRDPSKNPGGGRDRTPSPRPDVVQEEKFLYPDTRSRERLSSKSPSATLRRTPNEPREQNERGEVWKPIKDAPSKPVAQRPGIPSTSQQDPTWSGSSERPHDHHPEWRRDEIGFEPIMADQPVYSQTMPKQYHEAEDYGYAHAGYGHDDALRGKGPPPTPPQRRTARLQHQSSAPMPPIEPVSPPMQRATYSRTPPAKPRLPQSKSSSSMTPSKTRPQDKAPTIFYTRPNPARSERSLPKQHHPV